MLLQVLHYLLCIYTFIMLLTQSVYVQDFMSSGLVRNWIKSSSKTDAMRDSLGPAQFQPTVSLARLRESLSNETCVPPSAVDSLASVLQKKLHSFHLFELQLVRQGSYIWLHLRYCFLKKCC